MAPILARWTHGYSSCELTRIRGSPLSRISLHNQSRYLAPLFSQEASLETHSYIYLFRATRWYKLAIKRIILWRGFFFAFRAIFHRVSSNKNHKTHPNPMDFLIVFSPLFYIVLLTFYFSLFTCEAHVSLYKISPPRLGLSYRSRHDRDDTAKLSQKWSSLTRIYTDWLSLNWEDDQCSHTRQVSELSPSTRWESMPRMCELCRFW